MVTVILDEPMLYMGKMLPIGAEMTFSDADYEANKKNFKHHVKAKEIDGNHTTATVKPS